MTNNVMDWIRPLLVGLLGGGLSAVLGYGANQWQWWMILGIIMSAYFIGMVQGVAFEKKLRR